MLEVSEREEGVVALHLHIGSLKPRSGLEPVPRCKPSTYQPITDGIATAPSGPVHFLGLQTQIYHELPPLYCGVCPSRLVSSNT